MKKHLWIVRPLSAVLVIVLLFIVLQHNATAREQPSITMTTLLSGVTTGSSTALGTGTMPNCRETAVYVVWGAGTNAGVVTIESSYDSAYTGTWASLATSTWASASKQDIVQITGIHGALRARVSTTVTGGTVSVFAICN